MFSTGNPQKHLTSQTWEFVKNISSGINWTIHTLFLVFILCPIVIHNSFLFSRWCSSSKSLVDTYSFISTWWYLLWPWSQFPNYQSGKIYFSFLKRICSRHLIFWMTLALTVVGPHSSVVQCVISEMSSSYLAFLKLLIFFLSLIFRRCIALCMAILIIYCKLVYLTRSLKILWTVYNMAHRYWGLV